MCMMAANTQQVKSEMEPAPAAPSTPAPPPATGNNMVSNVADIFHAAGYAFKKLSELVQTMDPTFPNNRAENGQPQSAQQQQFQSHWDQSDVDQFSTAVNGFADELNRLTENLKNKIANRLREEHRDAKIKSLDPEEQQMVAKAD